MLNLFCLWQYLVSDLLVLISILNPFFIIFSPLLPLRKGNESSLPYGNAFSYALEWNLYSQALPHHSCTCGEMFHRSDAGPTPHPTLSTTLSHCHMDCRQVVPWDPLVLLPPCWQCLPIQLKCPLTEGYHDSEHQRPSASGTPVIQQGIVIVTVRT